MQKLLKYIILFGIFTLPLINSRITELLWFSFSMPVSWNYEFTKVMFFNIWSSLVIFLFFIQQILKNSPSLQGRGLGGGLIFFYIILLISTIFSESPIISFLWNNEKSHSFLMWSNLVWLFIVFLSLFNTSPCLSLKERNSKLLFNQIIKTFIFSWIFVSIIGLKEYFFPTFNYWDLANRLFSTFGHPNYLSIFLVGLMPFLYSPLLTSPQGIKIIIFFLFLITLILTKSFIAIFLFFVFNLFYFWRLPSFSIKGSTFLWSMNKKGMDYKCFSILIIWIIILWFSLIYIFLPEKLHSFVSRFFIWETTLKIIFSDIKIFFIGWGAETLTHFFNNFKSEYLYIFENLGYTADRPHNILLNFFYHFGIWWLVVILWIYYKLLLGSFKPLLKTGQTHRSAPTKISLILIFIFLLFNPTDIVIYVLIIILLANLFNNLSPIKYKVGQSYRLNLGNFIFKILFLYITIFSIFWAYFSYKHYISEIYFYKNKYTKALENYKFTPELYFIKWDFEKWLSISKIKTQLYYKYKIRRTPLFTKKGQKVVSEFLNKYNYAENYFYIWDLFWDRWKKEIAKKYYKKWLEKLPDLWNKNSKYYNKFIVKRLKINDHRLTSKKYWLAKVLERINGTSSWYKKELEN